MTHPLGYVDHAYLQSAAELLGAFKKRSYELMRIEAGHTVLDVGCGAGMDTIPLAELVPDGRVVGVDIDLGMLARADAAAVEASSSSRVLHLQADGTRLPLPGESFDSAHSERLFQHLPRPELALAEMVRVTRPGGRVVVLDSDHGTISIDTPEVDVERRLARFKADHMGHNGYAGRHLLRLFRQAGLVDVTIEILSGYVEDYPLARQLLQLDQVERDALSAGVVTDDELRRWRAGLEAAAEGGYFFYQESMVLAGGTRAGQPR